MGDFDVFASFALRNPPINSLVASKKQIKKECPHPPEIGSAYFPLKYNLTETVQKCSISIVMKKINVSQLAQELGIARQTIYYWIKKGWVKPKRDYRRYPIFTEEDVKKIKAWREYLSEE